MRIQPTLRFPQFKGDWTPKVFGDLFEISSASRVHKDDWTKSGVPFYRSSDVVSHYKGLKNSKAFISHGLFEELSQKSGCVKKDDLLVTGGGSIGIPYIITSNEPLYFKDADLLWFKNIGSANSEFIYAFLSSQIFKKYLFQITHIGTIAHYTIVQAKNTPIATPNITEQKKIAEFLGAVDEKIRFLQSRHDQLTLYKKGVMQKIFAQDIRFKADDGSDFPDWEKVKLDEIASFKKGKGIAKSDVIHDGASKCIRYGELYTTYQEKISEIVSRTNSDAVSSVLSQKNDLLMPTSDVTPTGLATASALDEEGVILGGDILVMRCKKILNIFFAYWVSANKKTVMRLVSGSTVFHLYGSDMATIVLNIPRLVEQQKIADFLTAIDDKIEAASAQIEHMQSFKKGLLQQMFV